MANTQDSQSAPATTRPSTAEPEPPFLPLHTAVVLLAAVVIGLVLGGLTALAGTSASGAAVVGLTSAGASVPVLRSLIR